MSKNNMINTSSEAEKDVDDAVGVLKGQLGEMASSPIRQLKGNLDACDEKGIRGWILDEDSPNQPVEITVLVDDRLVAQTMADGYRKDLVDAGFGNCSFEVVIPDMFFDGIEHRVDIKDVVSGQLLAGSPIQFKLLPGASEKNSLIKKTASDKPIAKSKSTKANTAKIRGHLDQCDEKISGWVLDENRPNESKEIEILIDGNLVAQITANVFRQDLLDSGIGNGRCAFEFFVPQVFFDGKEHHVQVLDALTRKNIGGSPLAFKSSYFCNNDPIQPIDQVNILGCVEYKYPTLIYGWAFSQNRERLNFSVLVNNREYPQMVEWFPRHDISEKYGDIPLNCHFTISPSASLKAAMSENGVKSEDILVLVNGLEVPKSESTLSNISCLKLAVVVHAYYEDQLEIINGYLQNIDCDYDLFITVPENVIEQLRAKIDGLFFRRELRIVKNIGNDVAPFLDLVKDLDKKGYDLVCKLQTKRDHEQYQDHWRNCLFDGVLGSKSLVDEIIQVFKNDPHLHLVGPALLYTSMRMSIYDAGDRLRSITKLLPQPSYEVDDWGFFAGTMFWARVSMFRPLQDPAVKNLLRYSESKSGELVGTAHLLERIFGLLPYIQGGGKTGIVDYRASEGQCSHCLRMLSQPMTPPQSLQQNIRVYSLIKKGIWVKWSALNSYKIFDKRWYFTQNPKAIAVDADPVLDFLTVRNKKKYINKDHQDRQIRVRFENDAVYFDAKDGSQTFFLNWPESLASECISPVQSVYQTHEIKSDIIVSVICITYNHEKYIKRALEGFVSQKTNFRFEVIIGDDASTDNTQDIIREYVNNYPEIFVPVLRSKNIGAVNNFLDVCSRIKGVFVAMNEGDDYWTDPNKLQIQVDYLNRHPKCTLSFHLVKVLNEIDPKESSIFPSDYVGEVFRLDDIVKQNFMQTNSVMYRWRFHGGFGDGFNLNAFPLDMYLHSLHAALGEIHLIPKVMGVYRKHNGGVFSSFTDNAKLIRKWGAQHIELYRTLDSAFDNKYTGTYLFHELTMLRTLIPGYWQDANFKGISNAIIKYKDTAKIVFDEIKININIDNIQDEIDLKRELDDNLKISVLVTSYNHVTYLAICLDSILAQRGLFSLEVIVADDDSSDGTREVAEDYAARYPDIIKVLPKTNNMGMLKNLKRGFNNCTGNFIAICEGDDYWLSEMKLNKQLWMLMSRPDLSMCFNWLLLHDEENGSLIPHPRQESIIKGILTFEDLIQEPLTANFSCCMYRVQTIRKIPNRYYNEEIAADWLFNLCASVIGDVGFLKETLSVYRIHEHGQWSGLSNLMKNEQIINTGLQFRTYFSGRKLPDWVGEINQKKIKKNSYIIDSKLNYDIRKLNIKHNCLFLEGWIIDRQSRSKEIEDKAFIITGFNNRVIYSQCMKNIIREDVDNTFSPNEWGRFIWSGFSTIFGETFLQQGEYRIWIGIYNHDDLKCVPISELWVSDSGLLEVPSNEN